MTTANRIDELRKKFDENPRRYFAPLANEYRKSGDLAQAIALCREHLPKQPGHMSGYIVLGQALYEAADLSEARTVFEQALALDPENLIALRHLGDIARASGDAIAARRWYERVLDADPRNDDIAAQLASLAHGRTPSAFAAQSPIASELSAPAYSDAFARAFDTPPLAMGAVGLGVSPTPDSVMRAVDLSALTPRTVHRTPIDLDEVVEAPAHAETNVEFDAETDVPDEHVEVIDDITAEHPVVTVHAESMATHDDDEDDVFGFASDADAANDDEVSAPDSPPFEEGLVAAAWPDTTEMLSRLVTPRSLTPRSLTPRTTTPFSQSTIEDAESAFGREADARSSAEIGENAFASARAAASSCADVSVPNNEASPSSSSATAMDATAGVRRRTRRVASAANHSRAERRVMSAIAAG